MVLEKKNFYEFDPIVGITNIVPFTIQRLSFQCNAISSQLLSVPPAISLCAHIDVEFGGNRE